MLIGLKEPYSGIEGCQVTILVHVSYESLNAHAKYHLSSFFSKIIKKIMNSTRIVFLTKVQFSPPPLNLI
jgi:hypothetical protein